MHNNETEYRRVLVRKFDYQSSISFFQTNEYEKEYIGLDNQTFLSSDNDFIYSMSNIYPKNSASWIICTSFQNGEPLFSSYHRVRVGKLLREDSVTASRFCAGDWHQIWHEIAFRVNVAVDSRRLKFHGQIHRLEINIYPLYEFLRESGAQKMVTWFLSLSRLLSDENYLQCLEFIEFFYWNLWNSNLAI